MTSGILRILGVDMGPDVHPTESHPRGDFEDSEFVELNKEIYRRAGTDYWKGASYQEIMGVRGQFDDRIRALVERKARGKMLWGWKDPMTNLTMELFLPFLASPCVVAVFRNPISTARSSIEFMAASGDALDFYDALRLNKQYSAAIIEFLAGHPDVPKLMLAFEDVLEDPAREAKRLAQFLGFDLTPAQAEAAQQFVIPRQRLKLAKRVGLIRSIPWRFGLFLRRAREDPRRIKRYLYQAAVVLSQIVRGAARSR